MVFGRVRSTVPTSPEDTLTDELVTIGRIVKPHGLRGEVAVDVLSDVPGRFDVGVEVQVDGRPATIATSRPHQGRILVRFDHVTDRSAAELLRGHTIIAPGVDLSESETYFVHELIGMIVVDDDDRSLGHVAALVELPPAADYDLLEVQRADGSTWLLPAVDDFVVIDEDEHGTERLRVTDPPEGLLDPEAADVAPPAPGPDDEAPDDEAPDDEAPDDEAADA
jgi:16S rRNA processing protein RimM